MLAKLLGSGYVQAAVSIPSLAGQTARRRRNGRRKNLLYLEVSIPSLAGQTARLMALEDRIRAHDPVSIPSLAGQTARRSGNTISRRSITTSFNPLISGADRATPLIPKHIKVAQSRFNPLISGADRATHVWLRCMRAAQAAFQSPH